ncbi:type VI secretion system baseplate subunit TssK [Pendulispora rubella]|uniref:Type VI secretion system baseplate subunit TssK n=1 Tax=Pendulispora rubella TaxID=2741070 RepID=A0ABZ2KX48_9BACT
MKKLHWENNKDVFAEHFRAADRGHEERLAYMFASLIEDPWGIERVEWDERQIRNSIIKLKSLSVIFSDGTVVDLDANDIAEMAPRYIVHDARASIEIFLALPRWRPNSEVFDGEPQQTDARYRVKHTVVPDFSTGEPTTFDWLIPAPQILLQGEPVDDFLIIPAGRVVRNVSNRFTFEREYIPAILTMEASPHLQELVRELHDRLFSYQTTLERQKLRDAAEAVRQRLLDIVTEALVDLKDYLEQPQTRPREIYRTLNRAVMRLAVFTRAGQAERIAFKYDDLGAVFGHLSDQLTLVLSQLGESPFRRFTFQDVQLGIGRIEIRDPSLFGDDLFLAVAGEDELRQIVPRSVRILSMPDLRASDGAATSGIRITPEHRAPANLPSGYVYFRLDKNDARYPALFKTQEIGIHAQGLLLDKMALYITKAPGTNDAEA